MNNGDNRDIGISSGKPLSMRVSALKEIRDEGQCVPVRPHIYIEERERCVLDTLMGQSQYPCGFPAYTGTSTPSPLINMKNQISPIYAPLTEMELAKLYARLIAANSSRKFTLKRVYNGAGKCCRASSAATAERAMQTLAKMGLAKKGHKNQWELVG